MRRAAIAICGALTLAWSAPGLAAPRAPVPRAAGAHGLTAKQRAAIDRYIKAEMARERIPGMEVGVYRDGHAMLEKGYGLASVELNVPVRADTLMQSGSIGKQFTATAIMMLVEQGKVGLDDSVTKYFPDAPESWKPIRIKNLLSHTSGLAEYEEGPLAEPGGLFDLRLDFTEDELVHKAETLPIEFKPGASWDYRNTNYLLLGILIHRVTGQFYGDYLHDKIFAPLGMSVTRVISDTDIIANRAAGYEIKGGKLKNQAFVSATFNATADGTLYYNLPDLEKWDRALYGASLISRSSLDLMWTPFLLNDGKPNSTGYGFAWIAADVNGHRVIEHSGAWQGFTGQLARYVDDKLTVVVLANLDSAHARPVQIERVVAGLVEPALMPKPQGAIADNAPDTAAFVRRTFVAAAAGRDVSTAFAASANYKFDPADGAELQASLPPDWASAPMVLVKRRPVNGGTSSGYRVGRAGDTRLLNVRIDAAGKITAYSVAADPDNR